MCICDMIKRNESDVGDVVFDTLAKIVFKFQISWGSHQNEAFCFEKVV